MSFDPFQPKRRISNDFRENTKLSTIWAQYPCLTRRHFYHLGAKEENRNPMIEALVTSYVATCEESVNEKIEQMMLMENPAHHIQRRTRER